MDPALWALLARRIDDARYGARIGGPDFRAVVRSVVRQLRGNGEAWDVVYSTLDAAVRPAPEPSVPAAPDHERYASRSASIVAHMHSWADVERLAEIEEEGHAS